MELPWLKNKNKNQGGGSSIERYPDEGTSTDRLIDMVADELLAALQARDRAGFREALHAFVSVIQEEDEAQDAATAGEI